VITRNRSLGALDHQRRDLHSIKLSYLTEDRTASSISFPLLSVGIGNDTFNIDTQANPTRLDIMHESGTNCAKRLTTRP
jgi:hypothetical protein